MVKLMQLKNKQFIMTVPKNIVNAMKLRKGDNIEFVFEKGDVIVRKIGN